MMTTLMRRKKKEVKPVALIVEDQASGLAVRSQLLSQSGFKVIGAQTFGEAVDRFQNHAIDIVITDINLIASDSRDQSGLDLARFIKERRPGLPIVAYSARFDENEISPPDRDSLDAMIVKGELTAKGITKQVAQWHRLALARRATDPQPQGPRKKSGGIFDAFLSHNSRDKETVRRLARKLRKCGLNVWFDEWELVPGRPWQEALEAIIGRTRSAIVLVGRDGVGPWEDREMRACLSEFVSRGISVIPVLLPGVPAKPELPLFLKQFTWVDLRGGLRRAGVARLLWGVTGQKHFDS